MDLGQRVNNNNWNRTSISTPIQTVAAETVELVRRRSKQEEEIERLVPTPNVEQEMKTHVGKVLMAKISAVNDKSKLQIWALRKTIIKVKRAFVV